PVLAARRGQAAGSMSGGEQQMLAIGRGLMSEPKILLLDEPSLGLSPQMVEALYELLSQIKERGVSFILVEQYVPLALGLCERAIALKKGVVAFTGRSEDIPLDSLTDVYMGGETLEEEAKDIFAT